MEIIEADLYDCPKYYDILYRQDEKAEFEFLEACFRRHVDRPVRRLFEPACGTGRLLARFAAAGYEVGGNDLSAGAVEYCNRRLARRGFAPAARREDMADFRLRRKADAAFNTLSSFRHLMSDEAAQRHLGCMADALAEGGIYVLGLHLTPPGSRRVCDDEAWTARCGSLELSLRMWPIDLDRRRRVQRFGTAVDVSTPSRKCRLAGRLVLRTYSSQQFYRLLDRVGRFEVAAIYDFTYDIDRPIEIQPKTEDAVFVLRKRGKRAKRPAGG